MGRTSYDGSVMPESVETLPGLPTLQRRLTRLAAVAILALLVATAGCALFITRWTESVDERRERRLEVTDATVVRLALDAQERAVVRFRETADATDLSAFETARRDEDLAIARLITRSNGEAELDSAIEEVGLRADEWRQRFVAPTVAAIESSRPDEAETVTGLPELDRAGVLTALDRLDVVVRADQVDADHRTEREQRWAVAALATAAATTLASIGGSTMLVRRWVTVPLFDLTESSHQLARGEIDDLPTFETEEFNDLARAVGFVDRERTEERDRATRAYESLSQSAVLALQVRQELVRHHAPAPPGWSIAAALRPAHGIVAGDCYDVGLLAPDTMYVIVIDVTGHGATAALAALSAKSVLRAALRAGASPGEAISWLGHRQGEHRPTEFLTAIVAVVEVSSGRISYANAGHPPALVLDPAGVTEMPGTGPLVGPFDATWATVTAHVQPGSAIVFYTDGLTEASDASRERLGEDRLIDHLARLPDRSVDEILASLDQLLDEFVSATLTDDVTMLALGRLTLVETTPTGPITQSTPAG